MSGTPNEAAANLVFDIFSHFGNEGKRSLLANNFIAVAARNRMPLPDVQKGIKYATYRGWIETVQNGGLKLTDEGLKKLQQRE